MSFQGENLHIPNGGGESEQEMEAAENLPSLAIRARRDLCHADTFWEWPQPLPPKNLFRGQMDAEGRP